MFKPLLLLFLAIPSRSATQTLDDIFALVQQNNLSLRTYEAQCNAAKAQARAGVSIADPDVEFGYLWGRPGEIGTRKDVAVSQSFDFATLFGARRRQVRSRAELADLELQQARNLVLFAAQQNVIDLTYANNRVELRQQRLATAQQLCTAYEQLLREGEVSKLSSTRAQLERATAEAELRRAETERDALLRQLHALCGASNAAQLADYPALLYPGSYLHGDLSLQLRRQELTVAEQSTAAAKAEGLPALTAGYMAELTHDEKWQGLTVGVAVPLWRNRRNMNRAHAEQQLAEAAANETQQLIALQRTQLKADATQLADLVGLLQQSLQQCTSTALLQKALQAGEIGILEFLQDRAAYYSLQDQWQEAQHDYQTALARWQFLQ